MTSSGFEGPSYGYCKGTVIRAPVVLTGEDFVG